MGNESVWIAQVFLLELLFLQPGAADSCGYSGARILEGLSNITSMMVGIIQNRGLGRGWEAISGSDALNPLICMISAS